MGFSPLPTQKTNYKSIQYFKLVRAYIKYSLKMQDFIIQAIQRINIHLKILRSPYYPDSFKVERTDVKLRILQHFID